MNYLTTSNTFLGCVSLVLTFAFCFISVHITKLFHKKENSKSPPPPQPKEETPPEPVYYIVEKKRKRPKSEFSAPKRIHFK